jgi:hypothetical protein
VRLVDCGRASRAPTATTVPIARMIQSASVRSLPERKAASVAARATPVVATVTCVAAVELGVAFARDVGRFFGLAGARSGLWGAPNVEDVASVWSRAASRPPAFATAPATGFGSFRDRDRPEPTARPPPLDGTVSTYCAIAETSGGGGSAATAGDAYTRVANATAAAHRAGLMRLRQRIDPD